MNLTDNADKHDLVQRLLDAQHITFAEALKLLQVDKPLFTRDRANPVTVEQLEADAQKREAYRRKHMRRINDRDRALIDNFLSPAERWKITFENADEVLIPTLIDPAAFRYVRHPATPLIDVKCGDPEFRERVLNMQRLHY